nr:uncharacterized protein CTRU02_06617 [Colletotrichum truncatum]KAF6792534.1 hypothetical protein CTRU02_06617 [Colletotrichum truncatum]
MHLALPSMPVCGGTMLYYHSHKLSHPMSGLCFVFVLAAIVRNLFFFRLLNHSCKLTTPSFFSSPSLKSQVQHPL